MRELKFRVWNGDYFEFSGFNFKTGCLGCNFSAYVELDTPQQFTGLKDEEGIELYDGDIYEQRGKTLKCEFDQVIYEVAECLIFDGDFKIIGNIYENPELLESK